MRKLQTVALLAALIFVLGCGGSGSGNGGNGGGGGGGGIAGCTNGTSASAGGNTVAASAPNVATITVDGGLPSNITGVTYVDGVFTTVTVCVPGGAPGGPDCQDIGHVLVDTGSYGLRLLSNAGGGALAAALSGALPAQHDVNNFSNLMAECAQFSDGITWGPIKMADIYVGGTRLGSGASEAATIVPGSVIPGMPVQIIGDAAFSTVPTACTSSGTPEDDVKSLLANGIIGVGPFAQDCGGGCTFPASDSRNPGLYYSCPPSGCTAGTQPTSEPETAQVWNPVAAFQPLTVGATPDNNGVIMELPGLPPTGLAVVNGSLVFGIGTQGNNGLGSATVYTGDPSNGNITTKFAGQTYSSSFIDSGSNGYFFPSTIKTCTGNTFYCPDTNLTCSAVNVGANSRQSTINFNIQSLEALPSASNAFNDIGGTNNPPSDSSTPAGFDWGLPFFFGRNVYTGMEQVQNSSLVQPPYYAY